MVVSGQNPKVSVAVIGRLAVIVTELEGDTSRKKTDTLKEEEQQDMQLKVGCVTQSSTPG